MDAFFAIEYRGVTAIRVRLDGLARTDIDARLRHAEVATLLVDEADMVAEPGRPLNFAADQQCILVRNQQLPVVGNRRPAAAVHQDIVQRNTVLFRVRPDLFQLFHGNAVGEILLNCGPLADLGVYVRDAFRYSRESHAEHARQESSLESVAGVLGNLSFLFDPALATALNVRSVEILFGERRFVTQQVDDAFSQQHARGPRLVDAGTREHIRAARSFADASVAVAHQPWLATPARFEQRFRAPTPQPAALQESP